MSRGSCFWFGSLIGLRDHVDPGCLVVGLLVGSIGQWQVEEAFVETIELFGFSLQLLQFWGRFLGRVLVMGRLLGVMLLLLVG
jgi:hypothetical protein